MVNTDIVLIGASIGGLGALRTLIGNLPKDIPASFFVAVHTPTYTYSDLVSMLNNAGPLPAQLAVDGAEFKRGVIYVSPNDHHLVLQKKTMLVRRGPKENSFRPSIDVLFRSAAYLHGERVIGVILSGILNDGVSGLHAIKQLGGKAIVQAPESADQPQLPRNVLDCVDVDHVTDVEDMPTLLAGMVYDEGLKRRVLNEADLERMVTEIAIASSGSAFELGIMDMGLATSLTCSECGGVVVRMVDGNILRYRCHTGHAYTASTLLSDLTVSIEAKMYNVMRGMEETHMLMNSISDHYSAMKDRRTAKLFATSAKATLERSRALKDLILEQSHWSEDLR